MKRRHCGNEESHFSHTWYEEWADMGVLSYECWGTPYDWEPGYGN